MRRVFITLLSVSLGLSALTGCGPQFQGSLTGRDGDGTGPTPPAGQAQISSVSPASAAAGAASFTLTVNGSNFVRSTTVLWDDRTPLTTTYVSSTVLQAQVPAALITRPTTVTIVPSPLVSMNFGTTFTITVPPVTGNNSHSASFVPVAANDIAWDQASQQFYLSVASVNGTNANTITALNPLTGLGASVSTGSEPGALAVSTDGAYIYAGLDSAGSVHRYTLPALQSDIDIPLGSNSYGPNYAIGIAAEPGNSHSVAISRGAKLISPRAVGGIAIYDDAVARPQSVPGFSPSPNVIDSLLWNPNGQSLYGINTETGESGFYTMSISSAGVQLETKAGGSNFGQLHFDSTTGYLYSNSGQVIDPATNAVIGSFPLNTLQGGLSACAMVPDGQLNIAYFLGQTNYSMGTNNYVEAFDLTHFTHLGAIQIMVAGTPTKIIRWGSNGLAFLTGDAYGRGAVGDGVYLISGGFVTSPAP